MDCRTVLHTGLAHFLKQLLVIYMDSFLIWIVSPDFSHIIRNTVFWTNFHSVADIFVVAIHFVVLCSKLNSSLRAVFAHLVALLEKGVLAKHRQRGP